MVLEGETVVFCPGAARLDWGALHRVGVGAHYAAERGHDHKYHLHEQHHHYYDVQEWQHHTNGQHHHVHDQRPHEHQQYNKGLHEHPFNSLYEFLEAGSSRAITDHECLHFCGSVLYSPAIIMANPCKLTVGYALTAKKAESFVKPGLVKRARSKGIIFTVIDHERPLLEQGPFDVILQKINGEVWHQQLKVYKQINPKVFIFDPPEAIKKVYNRKSMLQEVADLNFHHSQGSVGVPRQLVVDDESPSIAEEVAKENLKFPLGISFSKILHPRNARSQMKIIGISMPALCVQ